MLEVFSDPNSAHSRNLAPVAGVVEFFNACFLSKDTLEAIRKLMDQHEAVTDIQLVYDDATRAKNSSDHDQFCTSMIRLMACGQF